MLCRENLGGQELENYFDIPLPWFVRMVSLEQLVGHAGVFNYMVISVANEKVVKNC